MNTATHSAHVVRRARATGRPGTRFGYWLAAVLAVVGLAATISWATVRTLDVIGRSDDFPRTAIPGTVTTDVTNPGDLVVYFEGEGKPVPSALGLTVFGPTGTRIATQPYADELQYDAPAGGIASAVASFEVRSEGRYRVSATETPQPGARLAVGEDIGQGLVSALLWPGVLALGILLTASALAVWTHHRKGGSAIS